VRRKLAILGTALAMPVVFLVATATPASAVASQEDCRYLADAMLYHTVHGNDAYAQQLLAWWIQGGCAN
jgi:hypothetical protein